MESVNREEVRAVEPNTRTEVVQEEVRVQEEPVHEPAEEVEVVKEEVVVEEVDSGMSVQEAFDRELVRVQGLPLDAAITIVQRGMATRGVNAESSVVRDMLVARGF